MIARAASLRVVRLVVVVLAFVAAPTERRAHADNARAAVAPPSGPQVQTQPQADAAAHFRRGVELYDEGDQASALTEFRRAYDIAPDYRVLYNVGQAHYELREYAAAFRAFQRYLAEGGDRVAEARRQQVERDLARLEQRVARVVVRVDVSGANIVVDDVAVGASPLRAPLVVNLGQHRIKAQLGAREAARTIELAGGDRAEVVLELGPERAPERAGSTRRTVGWVVAGTGAALLATAVLFDLALVPNGIDEFEARRASDAPNAKDAQSTVHTLQAVAVAGYVGGAVLGGVGAALVLWPSGSPQASSSPDGRAGAIRLHLRGTGVLATAQF